VGVKLQIWLHDLLNALVNEELCAVFGEDVPKLSSQSCPQSPDTRLTDTG